MPNRRSSSLETAEDAISLPVSFFTATMPKIRDMTELKAVLYAAYIVLGKHSDARPDAVGVTRKELKAEIRRLSPESADEALERALASAVEHGTLMCKALDVDGVLEEVYFLGPSLCVGHRRTDANIFTLYEQNIGIITPMIAEELKEAERIYPPTWVEEAFKEAVKLNKRSWKYIARILERWASEGKDSGEHKGNAQEGSRDKYIRGKYGHLVKR